MNKCGHLATKKTNLGLAAHFQIETKEKLWATDCHEYYYLGAPGDHLDEFDATDTLWSAKRYV